MPWESLLTNATNTTGERPHFVVKPGEYAARQWLEGMRDDDAQEYPNNTSPAPQPLSSTTGQARNCCTSVSTSAASALTWAPATVMNTKGKVLARVGRECYGDQARPL